MKLISFWRQKTSQYCGIDEIEIQNRKKIIINYLLLIILLSTSQILREIEKQFSCKQPLPSVRIVC